MGSNDIANVHFSKKMNYSYLFLFSLTMSDRSLFQVLAKSAVRHRFQTFLFAVLKRFAASCHASVDDCVQRVMDMIDTDRTHDETDLVILDHLSCYLQMEHPPKKHHTTSRKKSRTGDIETELLQVKMDHWDGQRKCIQSAFAYVDVGCSEGNITEAVSETLRLTLRQTHACDIMPLVLPKNPVFQFAQNTPTSLPYPNDSFDLVTMFMSAHHFSDIHGMLSEIVRISRQGAHVIMREHCPSLEVCEDASDYYNLVHAIYACTTISKSPAEMSPEAFLKDYQTPSGYAHYRTRQQWVALMYEHGFQLKVEPHGPLAWNQANTSRFEPDTLFDAEYMWFRLDKK